MLWIEVTIFRPLDGDVSSPASLFFWSSSLSNSPMLLKHSLRLLFAMSFSISFLTLITLVTSTFDQGGKIKCLYSQCILCAYLMPMPILMIYANETQDHPVSLLGHMNSLVVVVGIAAPHVPRHHSDAPTITSPTLVYRLPFMCLS